jgi:curved DNA-binding protein CbpA
MAGDASAYAALGLDPGADSASIEQAYRKLIKEHHPDRQGGDTRRAAEIIEAYRAIRAERNLKDPLELNEEMGLPGRSGRGWVAAAMLLIVALGLVLILTGPLSSIAQPGGHRANLTRRPGGSAADPMDQPLNVAAIDGAARQALQLARTRDEMALAGASRDCHHLLRSAPTLLKLDRCAAFDDAVVQLEDRDPLRDQGPFSELAVTGRVWSGATALSDDSVAIDGRLDRIRLRVEEVIAPATAQTN